MSHITPTRLKVIYLLGYYVGVLDSKHNTTSAQAANPSFGFRVQGFRAKGRDLGFRV